MTVTYHVGDTRAVVATIPDGSVDLIASSPPFLALRSYLPPGHESKGDEIGLSETNPAAFIDTLLALTTEWGRVLAAHGSIAIELGDTYSGSGGGGGDYLPGGMREGQQQFAGSASASMRESNAAHWRAKNGTRARTDGGQYGYWPAGGEKYNTDERPIKGSVGWPTAKSLALIPQLYAVALAYGINPLTGTESPAGRWRVRNVIVWHRPNPAVGQLADKVRPSTSYIIVATGSKDRWFDLTAVRTELTESAARHSGTRRRAAERYGERETGGPMLKQNAAGAPPLDGWFDEWDGSHDTWTLTSQPSGLAHYAMWPAKLAERLTLMMCPREVCTVCGEPRRRIETRIRMVNGNPARPRVAPTRNDAGGSVATGQRNNFSTDVETLGWTDCVCAYPEAICAYPNVGKFRPGLVLDPFAGSGTTLAVADLHGRDAIGIDIDARNHDIYPARYDEVKRALFGTVPEMVGQLGLAL